MSDDEVKAGILAGIYIAAAVFGLSYLVLLF